MKKLSLLLIVASVAFFGCKDKGGSDGPSAPTSYTQKVILEYFSGAWCGYCPDGTLMAEEAVQRVPNGTMDYIVYHAGDGMDILDDDDIDDVFNNSGYPSGMVNRLEGETYSRYTGSLQTYDQYDPDKNNLWVLQAKDIVNETAKCGLAIDASSQSGDNLTVKVKLGIGANDMPEGSYYISCIMYEDEMTGTGAQWDQRNYFSKFGAAVFGASHPYYDLADPIQGYKHINAVRAILQNNPEGDAIDASALTAGSETTFEYTVNTAPFDSDLNLVAFIHEFTEGTIESSSYIYNAQFVAVGGNQDYD